MLQLSKKALVLRSFFLTVFGLFSTAALASPRFVYLTYEGDTGTSITVNFHMFGDTSKGRVFFDTESRQGNAKQYRYRARGTQHVVPRLNDGRRVHWIRLDQLKPGQTYYFIAGTERSGYSKEMKFRTIPHGKQPLRFVSGGDFGIKPVVGELLRHAAAREPHFSLLGGDIAYANGNLINAELWDRWLALYTENMVTPQGFMIPMVLAIGNHEVNGSYGQQAEDAPFFFNYFAQNGKVSYFRRQFGSDTVVYALDSGHTQSHGGKQAKWIEKQLSADQEKYAHRFALYHVPLYPSHRDYDTRYSRYGRKHWEPLFAKYQLTAAFENHDHTFKRSKLLANGKVVENGVLYLGDGAWGRGDRGIDLVQRWYLDKASSTRHFWLVDVEDGKRTYRAIDKHGKVFDVYPGSTDEADKADQYFDTFEQAFNFDEFPVTVTPLLVEGAKFTGSKVYVSVTNREQLPAAAKLSFAVPPVFKLPQTEFEYALKPGETQTFEVQLGAEKPVDPRSNTSALLKYDLGFVSKGRSYQNRGEVRLALEAMRRAPRRKVTVDGDLGEWDANGFETHSSKGVGAMGEEDSESWKGADDASYKFAVSHDVSRVYLAVEVRDDRLLHAPLTEPWQQDAIVIWVDSFPGEGDDDPNFAIYPIDSKKGSSYVEIDDAPEGIVSATQVFDGGYRTEISIPMDHFRMRLEEVDHDKLEFVRFNFLLSDLDSKKREPRYHLWRPAWETNGDFKWSGAFKLD
ncbi:Fibronectin type III domain-containing protein [Sulfidibacter corallicola]|uniref:Fibronectin type III domain-containing protein n=1 Tax=Sulfidibacter corallicola TaxID=2818388 RepID=A0A8A4TR06_SULCO|nr:fibronectin type III domain-containing protein [Sulfidibacter corallicola]QTD51980.1 fibronectin type III domain-containing protein [Sulfidibacter corallicola]